MRIRREISFALSLFTLLIVTRLSVSAQITWMKEYRGRTIGCTVSGLRGFGDACGFQYYDAAFVGRIISTEELPGDEFRVVVSPTEIFKGDLPATVEMTTRSGACLPQLIAGQEWLFSATRDEKSKELLLWYGSPGGPLPESQQQADRFRQLAHLKDSGLIVGEIFNGSFGRYEGPRAGQRIVVRSIPAGAEYVQVTDKDGHFEFPPLPVGKYTIDPNTVPGRWTGDGGDTTVQAHECRDYHIGMLMDGSIAGSIILPDGDTPRTWSVSALLLNEEDSSAAHAFTDGKGHFVLRGLSPGRYVIGIGVAGESTPFDLNFSAYAPGVRERAAALIIDLGKNENRDQVDIHLPSEALKSAKQPSPRTSAP